MKELWLFCLLGQVEASFDLVQFFFELDHESDLSGDAEVGNYQVTYLYE